MLGGWIWEVSSGEVVEEVVTTADQLVPFLVHILPSLVRGRGDHRRRRREAYMASAVKRYASPLTSCFVSIGSLAGGRVGVSAIWESSWVGRQGWNPKVFRPSRPPSRPGVLKHDRPRVPGAGEEQLSGRQIIQHRSYPNFTKRGGT